MGSLLTTKLHVPRRRRGLVACRASSGTRSPPRPPSRRPCLLHGDGRHVLSFDAVIKTMRRTGADMSQKYKGPNLGGLAVNVVAC